MIRAVANAQSFQRGKDYYENGAISNTTVQGNVITGDCEGTSAPYYRAQVVFDDNKRINIWGKRKNGKCILPNLKRNTSGDRHCRVNLIGYSCFLMARIALFLKRFKMMECDRETWDDEDDE